jgi:hypothetical protein
MNPGDENASAMYNEYQKKSANAKRQINDDWVFSPWPWDGDV